MCDRKFHLEEYTIVISLGTRDGQVPVLPVSGAGYRLVSYREVGMATRNMWGAGKRRAREEDQEDPECGG
jgi:hypothetical protein